MFVSVACTRSPYGERGSPYRHRRAGRTVAEWIPRGMTCPVVPSRVPAATLGPRVGAHWSAMTPVPASPDPESGPPLRPAIGRRRAASVPALSIGALDDVTPGSLLVAMPALSDPTFAGTVVYVLDH